MAWTLQILFSNQKLREIKSQEDPSFHLQKMCPAWPVEHLLQTQFFLGFQRIQFIKSRTFQISRKATKMGV